MGLFDGLCFCWFSFFSHSAHGPYWKMLRLTSSTHMYFSRFHSHSCALCSYQISKTLHERVRLKLLNWRQQFLWDNFGSVLARFSLSQIFCVYFLNKTISSQIPIAIVIVVFIKLTAQEKHSKYMGFNNINNMGSGAEHRLMLNQRNSLNFRSGNFFVIMHTCCSLTAAQHILFDNKLEENGV